MVIASEPATVNGSAFELAAPGCTTVTASTPAVASSAAGTTAVSCVELTNVVASGVTKLPAFHCAWLPGICCSGGGVPTVTGPTKLVPFNVTVRVPEPATALLGDKDVRVGTSTISIVPGPLTEFSQKSTAKTWKLKTPDCVGVPVMVALGSWAVRPGGRVSVPLSRKGGVPPVVKPAL